MQNLAIPGMLFLKRVNLRRVNATCKLIGCFFAIFQQKDYAAVIYKTHNQNQLFVGCFPDAVKSKELRDFFVQFGSVKDARFVYNKIGQPIPFGFLCTIENESTDKVLERLQDELKDMKINIAPAINRIRKDSNGMLGL